MAKGIKASRDLLRFMFIFLLTAPNASLAQYYSSDADSNKVKSITVKLVDDASDACWTNLKEVREYSEEKLKMAGYNVLSAGGDYEFVVRITAFRTTGRSRDCVGKYDVEIFAVNFRNGIFGFHKIGTAGGVGIAPDNLNQDAIELVSRMIEKM